MMINVRGMVINVGANVEQVVPLVVLALLEGPHASSDLAARRNLLVVLLAGALYRLESNERWRIRSALFGYPDLLTQRSS